MLIPQSQNEREEGYQRMERCPLGENRRVNWSGFCCPEDEPQDDSITFHPRSVSQVFCVVLNHAEQFR
jgi:hypothetical protein